MELYCGKLGVAGAEPALGNEALEDCALNRDGAFDEDGLVERLAVLVSVTIPPPACA